MENTCLCNNRDDSDSECDDPCVNKFFHAMSCGNIEKIMILYPQCDYINEHTLKYAFAAVLDNYNISHCTDKFMEFVNDNCSVVIANSDICEWITKMLQSKYEIGELLTFTKRFVKFFTFRQPQNNNDEQEQAIFVVVKTLMATFSKKVATECIAKLCQNVSLIYDVKDFAIKVIQQLLACGKVDTALRMFSEYKEELGDDCCFDISMPVANIAKVAVDNWTKPNNKVCGYKHLKLMSECLINTHPWSNKNFIDYFEVVCEIIDNHIIVIVNSGELELAHEMIAMLVHVKASMFALTQQ